MTRRLKRTKDYELTLQIKNDSFISPPREAQRNWILSRALSEFSSDLTALDHLAQRFVPGSPEVPMEDRERTPIAQEKIMEDWQWPILQRMADIVTEAHGDVLEVGYGQGVSARYIQELGVKSHTLIECNDSVIEHYDVWRRGLADRDIRMVHSLWQDAIDQLGTYDGVFFHTYPLNLEELVETVIESTTFAAHFFPTAASLLRPGGVFTYMTNEIDSFSREHQRLLLQEFRSVTLSLVKDVPVPDNVKDSWWSDSMVVVRAEK